uniref:Crp/Fnr family transcriptional regulator n=1 Tax=uncultured Nitrospira sp. TaxID=157176 RepID=UPI00314025A2
RPIEGNWRARPSKFPSKKGQFIFRQGDPADWFHIIKQGNVKCVKSSHEGREVTLKVLMPGDLFCCEASALVGEGHPGCAQSMGEGSIVKIHRKVMLDVIQRNPGAAVNIINYLSLRLRESQDNAKAFALDRAEQRVASILVNLTQRSGIQEATGIRMGVRLTHQDLADMAGLTKETTSRILSRFKKKSHD